MVKLYNPKILLSIFYRKGGEEGLFTKIVFDKNIDDCLVLFDKLIENEFFLIKYYRNEFDWVLITNYRLIFNNKGIIENIIYPDLSRVKIELLIDNEYFRALQLIDINDHHYRIYMEKGDSYTGIYQILSFVSRD